MKLEIMRSKGFVAFLLVLFAAASLLVPVCSAFGAAEAGDLIGEAERDLSSAYVAVSEAEGAGGDVSFLVVKLNGAGELLAKAHVAFRAGDYESASSFAVESSRALDGVIGDAARLKADAEEAHGDMVFRAACLSVVGLGLFLVLVLVGWQLLKKRYRRRVLDMKPEVGEGL